MLFNTSEFIFIFLAGRRSHCISFSRAVARPPRSSPPRSRRLPFTPGGGRRSCCCRCSRSWRISGSRADRAARTTGGAPAADRRHRRQSGGARLVQICRLRRSRSSRAASRTRPRCRSRFRSPPSCRSRSWPTSGAGATRVEFAALRDVRRVLSASDRRADRALERARSADRRPAALSRRLEQHRARADDLHARPRQEGADRRHASRRMSPRCSRPPRMASR